MNKYIHELQSINSSFLSVTKKRSNFKFLKKKTPHWNLPLQLLFKAKLSIKNETGNKYEAV